MGHARFSRSTYSDYAADHKLLNSTRDQVFASRNINQALDPSKITIRESRDSDTNPNSTPIIIGLDVTGSMGFIAEDIAKNGLPKIMEGIYEQQAVSDPHVMFMGIGDVIYDRAPLQVSQFEAGAIPLIEQLRSLYLEGGGGGNRSESYHLPWYFAALKTSHDCYEKREKRGYLFTIGDEEVPPTLTQNHLRVVFGESAGDLPIFSSTDELLMEAEKTYNVFHIIAEQGNHCRGNLRVVREQWSQLLGQNVLFMNNKDDLSDIIDTALRVTNGENIHEVIEQSGRPEALRYAFANVLSIV